MERHHPRLPLVSPDAQRYLLRHGTAREKNGGFFAQQRSDFALEVVYQRTFAISVRRLVASRLGKLGQHQPRLMLTMPEQKALTALEELIARGFSRGWYSWHERWYPRS
jgi:hypothetical protein